MERLALTYKWFAAGKIFCLLDKYQHKTRDQEDKADIFENPNFRCLIRKCIEEFVLVFDKLKYKQPSTIDLTSDEPTTAKSFFVAEKYLLNQIIQLQNNVQNYKDAAK